MDTVTMEGSAVLKALVCARTPSLDGFVNRKFVRCVYVRIQTDYSLETLGCTLETLPLFTACNSFNAGPSNCLIPEGCHWGKCYCPFDLGLMAVRGCDECEDVPACVRVCSFT